MMLYIRSEGHKSSKLRAGKFHTNFRTGVAAIKCPSPVYINAEVLQNGALQGLFSGSTGVFGLLALHICPICSRPAGGSLNKRRVCAGVAAVQPRQHTPSCLGRRAQPCEYYGRNGYAKKPGAPPDMIYSACRKPFRSFSPYSPGRRALCPWFKQRSCCSFFLMHGRTGDCEIS